MEERLAGGNMNVVVRVGDTVRRTAGPWTPSVHALLQRLHAAGIGGIPRPLGIDAQGREILSFVDGDVPVYPMPSWVWADAVLADAARLLRRLHDASVGFAPSDAVWQFPPREPAEVICHNDFSPHNLVFRAGTLVGAIDFDGATPGPRLWDLAYLATRLVPITDPAVFTDFPLRTTELERRIAVLISAYGITMTRDDLLREAVDRLEEIALFSEKKAVELNKPELAEHARGYRRDAAFATRLLNG